jgi:hypothetical protein
MSCNGLQARYPMLAPSSLHNKKKILPHQLQNPTPLEEGHLALKQEEQGLLNAQYA